MSASENTQTAVGTALRVPQATIAKTRNEATSIWREARALSNSWGSGSPGSDGNEPIGPPSSQTVHLAWYAGLGAMGLLRLIEWRLAAVLAAAHTVEQYGHRRRLQEFVEGLDAGL